MGKNTAFGRGAFITLSAALLAAGVGSPVAVAAESEESAQVTQTVRWETEYVDGDRAGGVGVGIANHYPQHITTRTNDEVQASLACGTKRVVQEDVYVGTRAQIDAIIGDGILEYKEDWGPAKSWQVTILEGACPQPEPALPPKVEPPVDTPKEQPAPAPIQSPAPPNVLVPPVVPQPSPITSPKPIDPSGPKPPAAAWVTRTFQVDAYTPRATSQARVVARLDDDRRLGYREDRVLWGASAWQFVTVRVPANAKAAQVIAAINVQTSARVGDVRVTSSLATARVGARYTIAWELGRGATPRQAWGADTRVNQICFARS